VDSIIMRRQHVMRAYGQMAVRVFRNELNQAGRRTGMRARRRTERLLRREPEYLDASQHRTLVALLDQYGALARTLGMRAELRQLWQGADIGPQEALARLTSWCERAERAGVPALHAFAVRLRAYGREPSTGTV
jgi:stearoyl-CoA desaturase (delta-9 desaturase)